MANEMTWAEKLAAEDRRLERRETEIDQEIEQLRERKERISAERRVIRRWREDPPEFLTQLAHGPNGASGELGRAGGKRPTPMEGIDTLVEKDPGVKRLEAIDRLEHAVESESPNVRSIISSSISRRVRQEKIYQDEDDKLWPWNHPTAVERREKARERERMRQEMQGEVDMT